MKQILLTLVAVLALSCSTDDTPIDDCGCFSQTYKQSGQGYIKDGPEYFVPCDTESITLAQAVLNGETVSPVRIWCPED